MKAYFSLSDNQRRIYRLNQRAAPQKTGVIIKRIIKEKYKSVVVPVKKYVNNFIRKKILKINDESKVGLDKLILNFKDEENLKKECSEYRDKHVDYYFDSLASMIEPQYNQDLILLKEKLKKHYPRKKSEKLKQFFEVKQNMIDYLISQRKEKLKKEFPEFDNNFLNNAKSFFGGIKSFGIGVFNGLISALSFNHIDFRIKDSKSQTIEKIIMGVKETEYNNKLEDFKRYESDCFISTLKDDIEFLVKSTPDEHIFKLLEDKKDTDKKNLEMLRKKFKTNFQENSILLIENNNKNINKNIKNDEDDYDDKSESLISLK